MLIPKGKKIKIKNTSSIKGKKNVSNTPISNLENVDLVLEEDIVISLQSNFSPIVSSDVGAVQAVTRDFIGSASKAITGKKLSTYIKELGFQIYTGTKPLAFSATIGLYMKQNAQFDVYKPAIALSKLVVPTDLGSSGDGIGLQSPGAKLGDLIEAKLSDSQSVNRKDAFYYVTIGNVVITPAIIIGAEPTFSREVDQFGYPIWAKVRLDVNSLFIPTTNLLDQWEIF